VVGQRPAWHQRRLVRRVPVRSVPPGPQRCGESSGPSESSAAAASRATAKLLDGVYADQPFRQVLRDLGITPNQVWGLAKTDEEWSEQLDAALTAAGRDDLKHGSTPAYVRGCVCSECRAHQRFGLGGSRANPSDR
jgi:hypothetical protein